MPPFRYLGNILRLRECAFRLGYGAREGEDYARADGGGAGLCRWRLVLRASALIDQYRPGPLCPFARLLASEMFV